MKIIEDYNKSLQAIYDHVGFVEDWVIYPIDDCLDKYWYVDEMTVTYHENKKQVFDGDNYYRDEIYTPKFYEKWIYEGDDFTMIFCNPGVDGMKYFRIFDNSKKVNIKE